MKVEQFADHRHWEVLGGGEDGGVAGCPDLDAVGDEPLTEPAGARGRHQKRTYSNVH
ncbi:hypothetical protein GCM10020229_53360 [Kitasatospora albolonga]